MKHSYNKLTGNTIIEMVNKDQKETSKDKIMFDSLVDNEKEHLRKTIKSELFEDHPVRSYPCSSFIEWIFRQFGTIKYPQPSSTTIYNLEFLQKVAGEKDLLKNEGSSEKKEEYMKTIKSAGEMNYEADDLDLNALATATKDYIKLNVEFFNKHTVKKMSDLYGKDNKEDRAFFIERLPFIMHNRTTFRYIKNICGDMESKDAVQIWADAVVPEGVAPEKRIQIMNDLLKTEFEYVPISFYK